MRSLSLSLSLSHTHMHTRTHTHTHRSRPENLVSPMVKNSSMTSLDSEEASTPSSESALSRASTMGAVERIVMRGKNSVKSRPLSTASSNSSKDLEASFEVGVFWCIISGWSLS